MKVPMEAKKEVLDLKATGFTTAEIASRTGVSQRSIECYWKKWQQELIAAGYYSQHVDIVPDDPETQAKRRAVRLMDQGWKSRDAAKKTGLKMEDIAEHWEEWAAELGMEIIQRKEEPVYPDGEVKEVALPVPEAAPDMPCPVEEKEKSIVEKVTEVTEVTKVTESSAKTMEASTEASVKSMDKSIGQVDAVYTLMSRLNALVHEYLRDEGRSLRDVSQEMEISEGHLTVVLSLNLGETPEDVWEAVEDVL